MKTTSKLFTAVLISCALVLAFTACAGCTGTDPIVGTWVHTNPDNSKTIFEFESPEVAYITQVNSYGTVTKSDKDDGMYTVVKKTGDNRYESGLLIFTLSQDGYTMTETTSTGNTYSFTKYSNYVVPTSTPTPRKTASPTLTPTPAMTKTEYKLVVMDKISGSQVSNIMTSANMFNDVPKTDTDTGYLIKYSVNCKSLSSDPSIEINGDLFKPHTDLVLVVSGKEYTPTIAVMPKSRPEIEQTRMFEGDTKTGWAYFIAPAALSGNECLEIKSSHSFSNTQSVF